MKINNLNSAERQEKKMEEKEHNWINSDENEEEQFQLGKIICENCGAVANSSQEGNKYPCKKYIRLVTATTGKPMASLSIPKFKIVYQLLREEK